MTTTPNGTNNAPHKPHVRFTEERQGVYLKLLADTMRPLECCEKVGIGIKAISDARKGNPLFIEREAEARAAYYEKIEREIERRGIMGVEEAVFYKGKVVGYVRRHDSHLLTLLAKRHIKEYRDHLLADVNISGRVLVVGATANSKQEWADRFAPTSNGN